MYDDEWISSFSAKAAPRLKSLFEADLHEPSARLEELLKRLREAEAQAKGLALAA